jgi:C1A family cysteine protease
VNKVVASGGSHRDETDQRDWDVNHSEVKPLLEKTEVLKIGFKDLPQVWDLSQWFSPIERQQRLNDCSAFAVVALVEYYERRLFQSHTDVSIRFLYRTTRKLLQSEAWEEGDSGATLRATMKALAQLGVPPEKHWPYDESKFDEEPSAFCYALAQNRKAVSYFRLDSEGVQGKKLLNRVKQFLYSGFPVALSFNLYEGGYDYQTGEFLLPGPGDQAKTGHSVVAVGFDNERKSAGQKGALKIRNCWGSWWGEGGYGWLPYRYVTNVGLSGDYWCLIEQNFTGFE